MGTIFFAVSALCGGVVAWLTAKRIASILGVFLGVVAGVICAYGGLHLARLLVMSTAAYDQMVYISGERVASEMISDIAERSFVQAVALVLVFAFLGRRSRLR